MVKNVSFVDSALFENEDKKNPASVSSKNATDTNILERFLIESDDKKSLLLWIEHITLIDDIALTKATLSSSMLQSVNHLDDVIEKMVNSILHHSLFQSLEASWLSISYLIDQQEKYDRAQQIKIKILDCNWLCLSKDLNKAMEFNHSGFFNLVYSEEFDRPGGEPFGLIIGDYNITHINHLGNAINDIDTLKTLALICAAACSPFITSAAPSLFGVDEIAHLGGHIDLTNHFNQPEFIKWRSLREMDESRFIGITVPNVLMRTPYTNDGKHYQGFRFRERIKDVTNDHLWGNAAYALAGVILRTFSESSWFGHIRGMKPGSISKGIVSDLAVMPFETNQHPQRRNKPFVNLQITKRGEAQLSDNGFIALSHILGCKYSVFYGNSSVYRPNFDKLSKLTVNYKLLSMLQYTFCIARFAHYIKILTRERIGTYSSAAECENEMQHWIMQYTTDSGSLAENVRAQFPLSYAKVKIKDVPGRPGHYYSIIQLKPYFQLEELVSNLQLITDLT